VTISELPANGQSATVDFRTVDGTATVANNDYVAAQGTLTFNSNSPTLQRINVTVNGDTTFEPNEVFIVRLSNPVNASIIDFDGIGTIFNDDVEPRFSVNNVSANEGNSGTTPFVFTFTRSGNATAFSSVLNYATANGTATAPGDYAAASGSVTFAPNETTKTVTVNVVGDTVVEPNETFTVSITSVTNGIVATATGTGTIVNDDGGPTPTPTPTPALRPEGDVVDGAAGPNGDNLVLTNDLNYVRGVVLGTLPPIPPGPQFQAADVNRTPEFNECGNGQIDLGDVTVIGGYILGNFPLKPVCGPTGPTGNTEPPPDEERPDDGRLLTAGTIFGVPGQNVVLPISLEATGIESATSFTVNFDPNVLMYVSTQIGSGVPSGSNIGLNSSQSGNGRIGVLVDSTNAFEAGTREVIKINFTIRNTAPYGTYPIEFSGTPTFQSVSSTAGVLLATKYRGGTAVVVSDNSFTVSGRILSPEGIGVRNVQVRLSEGGLGGRPVQTVTTSSFGVFTFNNVPGPFQYVVSVSSKRYRFAPRTITANNNLTDIDMIGLQ
jgi:Calx-beta domain/Cohesin domain/Carboxypeptidase regulatory-like domain